MTAPQRKRPGRPQSEATRKILSDKAKQRYADWNERAEQSERMKAGWPARRLKRPPQYTQETMPERSRRRRYGLTRESFSVMLGQQEGCCAICARPIINGRQLAVDHDHETGLVRALLCVPCNAALGWYERFGAKAVAYLARYALKKAC